MVLKKDVEDAKKLAAEIDEQLRRPPARVIRVAGRHTQIVRLLFVIRDLDKSGGMTLDELRLKHSVDERTARRDINTLQEVGLPIVEEEGPDRRKRWRIAFRDKLQEVATLADVSHYFALIFALRQGSALRGTPIFTDAEDLGDKLLDFISGKGNREFLMELDNCFYSSEKHAYKEARIDVIWPLAMAIIKKREVVVTYKKEGDSEFKNHTVLPLKLMVHNGAVHLVHKFKGSKTMGKLKLVRFWDLKVLKTTGERPSEQAIEAYLTRGFGLSPGGVLTTYDLLFRPEKRDAVCERIWHHTQRLDVQKDGWVRLRFTVGQSEEVTAWICSWRTGVRVLAPKSEIVEVYKYCKWGVELYEPMMPKKRGPKPKVKATPSAP